MWFFCITMEKYYLKINESNGEDFSCQLNNNNNIKKL